MKTITFAVPCYNSAEYMDKCIESLLACESRRDDIEIILVDDGSTKDDTPAICDRWQEKYPDIIRAVHQENAGHGGAVNRGLAEASGRYFKVVDSDDWLDKDAMCTIMNFLRPQSELENPVDLVIGNYVYEKVYEGTHTAIRYSNVFPENHIFTWNEIGHFHQSQYLLMHSVIYRTDLLREVGLELPTHCFYVDNIFVYVPLPAVKTIRYFNVDMYRYFIGREGQSVNEDIMMARIDQQLRITRFMIDKVDLPADVEEPKLERYMERYLSMMMCICSIFLRKINTPESEKKREEIWDYLLRANPVLYKRIRHNVLNMFTNLPNEAGRRIGLSGYWVAQKLFKFN
ncbi:MAG: glycosyltransferase family 2 protein [Eggerthellaceae bacterium]|jgi:glycosyltransferase involved in cell wall biosynthesis